MPEIPVVTSSTDENDPWPAVLSEALERASSQDGGPVPGARLRKYVEHAAELAHLALPSDVKFAEFLQRYPDVVVLLRRAGTDLLAAPARRPEMLADDGKGIVIRRDLFEALTAVRAHHSAWYHRPSDAVVWLPADAEIPSSFELVPMPLATTERELALRREFIGGLGVAHSEAGARLDSALEENRPLSAFSREVRSHGLAHRWHVVRSKAVVEQLREWSEEKHVVWGTNWLTQSDQQAGARERSQAIRTHMSGDTFARNFARRLESQRLLTSTAGAASSTPEWLREGFGPTQNAQRDVLRILLERLSDADLARISVPMDLIAKALTIR